MSYLGMNQVRSFSFSPENKYTQEYYNAYRKLSDAQFALKNSKTNSVEQTKNLQAKFDYWDKKLPQIKKKAEIEENKLQAQKKEEQNNTLGKNLNLMA